MRTLTKKFLMLSTTLVLAMSGQISFAADYPDAGDAAAGAKVWGENCSRCHNARDPRDLRDDQWITSGFHMRIRGGLTGQQTRDVITFLQKSNEPVTVVDSGNVVEDTTTASTLSGPDVYRQTCIACHGANGGGLVPGTPDFRKSSGPLSQSDDVLFKHIKNGFQSPGSPMAMPAKGGNSSMNDADLRGVIEYLRSEFGG